MAYNFSRLRRRRPCRRRRRRRHPRVTRENLPKSTGIDDSPSVFINIHELVEIRLDITRGGLALQHLCAAAATTGSCRVSAILLTFFAKFSFITFSG